MNPNRRIIHCSSAQLHVYLILIILLISDSFQSAHHTSCQQKPSLTAPCKTPLPSHCLQNFPPPSFKNRKKKTDITLPSPLLAFCSDLLRRLPPHSTTQNLNRLCALAPHLTEDLLSAVDQPLEVRRCKRTGRDYLLCDYNRDGDSWRSPWSNEFEPPLENDGGTAAGEDAGGAKPGERVRALEIKMGEAIDLYREL